MCTPLGTRGGQKYVLAPNGRPDWGEVMHGGESEQAYGTTER